MQGKTISGYTLKRHLGTGGMAEVWYAENKIGKKAAVKLLLYKFCQDENVVSRFLTEAKVMVELNHPNIRQVYDSGDIEGRPAIVMEYLEGEDLKARMKRGQHFTDEELQRWWNQMVDALNYTHNKDIVHRDIKPSNIFVDDDGNIKLLDFGIAKVRDSISATLTGQKLGTLMYMSPEQVRDPKRVGVASDAYSLAVTFVHLLTGRAPYDSTTDSDYDIQESIVRKPLDLSAVPKAWRGFLDLYLEKDPNKRLALQYYAKPADVPKPDNDEETEVTDGTMVASASKRTDPPQPPQNDTLIPQDPHSGLDPLSPTPNDNPKNGKALWIAIAAVAVIVLLVLLLRPKPVPTLTDPDTQAYDSCQTVYDYRAYINQYGQEAKHYSEAQAYVEQWVADSIATADSLALVMQEAMALAQAQQQAEDDAYKKCTTIEGCERYLKDYPQGRYVEEVIAKRKGTELQPNENSGKSQKTEDRRASTLSVDGNIGGHDYVDLGLPSGTLWATCNVGASKPEDYGNYFAWGETSTKSTYDWDTYKYANGAYNKQTKYCSESDYGNNGFTDNLTTLQTSDDPAMVNWGSRWCMPTKAQWEELESNTTSKWTLRNGVRGRLFTAKNGRTVFLPTSGKRKGRKLTYAGSSSSSSGCYWSTLLCTKYELHSSTNAWFFCVGSGSCGMGVESRSDGLSVRPVLK